MLILCPASLHKSRISVVIDVNHSAYKLDAFSTNGRNINNCIEGNANVSVIINVELNPSVLVVKAVTSLKNRLTLIGGSLTEAPAS